MGLVKLTRRHIFFIDSFHLRKACAAAPPAGRQIHAISIHLGLDTIVFLQSSIIKAYSSTGNVQDARKLFDSISQPNHVCWTALISGYVNNGMPRAALDIFRTMQMERVDIDHVTATTALSACADVGDLEMGQWIHNYVRHHRRAGSRYKNDLILVNALVNMYAKCGDIGSCLQLFRDVRHKNRDVTTWTSVIVGLALNGQSEEALHIFTQMKTTQIKTKVGVRPNKVTFIGVLMACSHAGFVEQGVEHLSSMKTEYGLEPEISHLGCMVDLFCRAGYLYDALEFIENLSTTGKSKSTAVMWRTLLGASSLRGSVAIASHAMTRLHELKQQLADDDVVMSNTFAMVEMWAQKERLRKGCRRKRRTPGHSMIEVDSY